MTVTVDTVKYATDNPDVEQPYAELGLKADEYARIREILGRRPTSCELAMYSVMWSEHCSYKSSKVHLRKFGDLPAETHARQAAGRHRRAGRRRRRRPGVRRHVQGRVAQPPELRRALPGCGHRRRRDRPRHPRDGRAPGRGDGQPALRPAPTHPTPTGSCPAWSPASAVTATASACPTSAARWSSTRRTPGTPWSTRSASGVLRHEELHLARPPASATRSSCTAPRPAATASAACPSSRRETFDAASGDGDERTGEAAERSRSATPSWRSC